MLAGTFRELLVLPAGAHQLVLRAPPDVEVAVAAEMARQLMPHLDVWTWRQLMPTVATMLDSTRGLIFFVFIIVYIAIGILILNAMLMAVFERIREFGVMKAIGVSPQMVMVLILAESAIQTGIALVLGLGFAVPAGWYLATQGLSLIGMSGLAVAGLVLPPIWYAHFTVGTVTGPVVVMVFIVSVGVLYPALKAALIRPVEAMRYT
jgi:ABC-type antimicrobial peptide transport system permease subunit